MFTQFLNYEKNIKEDFKIVKFVEIIRIIQIVSFSQYQDVEKYRKT